VSANSHHDRESPLAVFPAAFKSYNTDNESPVRPSQYLCLHPQCARTLTGFGRYADLERHIAIVHNRSTLQLVDCTYPGCHRRGEYGFTRKDKMVEHLRDVHKADIPKRARGKSNSP